MQTEGALFGFVLIVEINTSRVGSSSFVHVPSLKSKHFPAEAVPVLPRENRTHAGCIMQAKLQVSKLLSERLFPIISEAYSLHFAFSYLSPYDGVHWQVESYLQVAFNVILLQASRFSLSPLSASRCVQTEASLLGLEFQSQFEFEIHVAFTDIALH